MLTSATMEKRIKILEHQRTMMLDALELELSPDILDYALRVKFLKIIRRFKDEQTS